MIDLSNPILFAGREYCTDTDNYFYRFRYLNTTIGRFSQKDPLLYINGLNDYSYVSNSPIILYDPYGLTGDYNSFINGRSGYWYNYENITNPNAEDAMMRTWGNNKPNTGLYKMGEQLTCDVFERSAGENAGNIAGNLAKGAGSTAAGAGKGLAGKMAGAGGKLLGAAGVGLSLAGSANAGRNSDSYLGGLVLDMLISTGAGAAGGAIAGSLAGGVGAGPGAGIGAAWGAGTSLVGYTWGYFTK